MNTPQILKKMNTWFRTPREPDVAPVEFDRSDWIPEIRRRLSGISSPAQEPVITRPTCFSCGQFLLEVVFGRGAGFGPMPNSTYGFGCVISHETPKYICGGCGLWEGRLFEDIPEPAVERIAKADAGRVTNSGSDSYTKRPRKRRERTSSGRQLARREGLNVKKAYYHWEGTFFQRVHEFPVALFDRFGYVVLNSQREYLNHHKISGKERTNIPSGIASFSTYKKMSKPAF